ARYAGLDGEEATDSANNEKLLQMLHGATDRSAYFECALVLVRPDMPLLAGNGKVEGKILYEAEGEGGFGYDPLFYSIELKKSFGVATKEEKNTVSHRSRALADLISKLKEEA
ncbi:MAG: non-canonical purine NTP pyrophosphatase, partial [Clostridia bacterium]|nr:non-canonical purine NTP pyrophosphatase [Clostridia bacterium]